MDAPVIERGKTLKQMQRELILWSLEQNQGDRTKTAHELGISIRNLRNKLNQYWLEGHRVTLKTSWSNARCRS